MSQEDTATPVSISLSAEALRNRVKQRLFRALDYLSIFAFIVIVYGSAVLADYLLFLLLWALLDDEVRKYPVVARALDYARIGLALLFIFSAVVHGVISTYSQIRLDMKLANEGE